MLINMVASAVSSLVCVLQHEIRERLVGERGRMERFHSKLEEWSGSVFMFGWRDGVAPFSV